MKKGLIFIIVFVSMIAVAYALAQATSGKQGASTDTQQADTKPTPTPSNGAVAEEGGATEATTPQPQAATVTYSDDGFTPQTVTISPGSTVTFISKTDAPVWVASDEHPEHTDYPGFDFTAVKNRLPQPGDEFSFTFEKAGTWGYHDHNAPERTGQVIVK